MSQTFRMHGWIHKVSNIEPKKQQLNGVNLKTKDYLCCQKGIF